MTEARTCRQCGTCCRKGGPALTRADLPLVRRGVIRHDRLVVIRKGELGHNPATGRLEPVPVELLKVRGQGQGWACLFLDPDGKACTIYEERPQTCRILECWQPEALLATIYRDPLARADLINPDDPVLAFLARHEQACPGESFTSLLTRAGVEKSETALARLTAMIRTDLAIRHELAERTGISLETELFLLGRPLFRQLAGSGLTCREEHGDLQFSFT